MVDAQSIGLQLYSVREALDEDFEGTTNRIAEIGYRSVETYGFSNMTAQAAKTLFDSLDIKVSSAHLKLPLGDIQNEILETMDALGSKYLICPWLDPDPYFVSVDGIKQACEMLNEANQVAQNAGLVLGYHNHWFEYGIVEGKPAYQYMAEYLDDNIFFELDTYWIQVAGIDPVEVIKEFGSRVPFLHIKDGPATNREAAMQALGTGAMNIPAMLEASQADWHIVELDRCDTDMLEAVEKSYQYMSGLAK